jgi:hypothetical protein
MMRTGSQQTQAILQSGRPDYIYVAAGGLAGVMQAIRDVSQPVRVIANDLTLPPLMA